jgi:Ferredoxin-dependent bilin reductase
MSIITNLFALPASAVGLDLSDAARQVDGALHTAGCKTVAVPDGLGYVQAGLGLRAIATTMLESERVSRAIVSHVRVAPFFASLIVVVHPKPEIDAPLCVVDLHVVPGGGARAYVDVCGPAIDHPEFRAKFFVPLNRALGRSSALHASPVPAWMAALSGGCGAVVSARPGSANRLFGLSLGYVQAYLQSLDMSPVARNPAENRARAQAVADAARVSGRAGRMLARSFGTDIGTRYARLLWNQI